MQRVSAAWLINQEQPLTSEGFVRISYELADPKGFSDGTISVDNPEMPLSREFSLLRNNHNKSPKPYICLDGSWKLDGTRAYLTHVGSASIGYVSEIREDPNPEVKAATITLAVPNTTTIPGITISWGRAFGEFPLFYRVVAYLGDEVVADYEVQGNESVDSFWEYQLNNYDKIEIYVRRWIGDSRRIRIDNILLGKEISYDKNSIISFNQKAEGDPISTGMFNREVEFTLDNSEGQWNPENPAGYGQYLKERQEISVQFGYKLGDQVEWVHGSTTWLSEWEVPQNGITAKFTARDLTSFMQTKYKGTLDDTLYNICDNALIRARLPIGEGAYRRWNIDDSLKLKTITLSEGEYTIAEVVQLVCNASQCVYYEDRFGQISIAPLEGIMTDYRIDKQNSFAYGEYSYTKPVDVVNVNGVLDDQIDGTNVVDVDNPFITTPEDCIEVGNSMLRWLQRRAALDGEYRADPRLDLFDVVSVDNKYRVNIPLLITSLEYTFGGAFKGRYAGRIYEDFIDEDL